MTCVLYEIMLERREESFKKMRLQIVNIVKTDEH